MARPSVAVVWFRRDLRIHDHPALTLAGETFDAVLPLFVVDETLLDGRWVSPNRLWFMQRSVAELATALAERGAPLTVLRGRPAEVVPRVAAEVDASAILVSRDYAPYGRRRDRAVAEAAGARGISFQRLPGVLVHEPETVLRPDGGHFTVFSPFQRAWQAQPTRVVAPAPNDLRPAGARPQPEQAMADLLGGIRPTADEALMPVPGENAARERLADWAASAALDAYDSDRDRLDRDGTSRLSQDLRWGLLSPLEVVESVAGDGRGRRRYLSEICWRDFYAHLLWHEPRVHRAAFRRDFEGVAWETDEAVAHAWREGRTGYPVVDAAMRQLARSGWMHNRARMIVASFLTKHLGVDWRVGETHFMQHLLDGDVASNNGGWQWAASTGTDPQPYFRIFNPTLQGRRHDPDGEYVRRWLPELRYRAGPQPADVHEPAPGAYRQPIVDYAAARRRALAAYEERRAAARR